MSLRGLPIKWRAVDQSKVRPFRDAKAMAWQLCKIRMTLGRETRHQSGWARAGWLGVWVVLLVILATGHQYGISFDEGVQQQYGRNILKYYSSGFEDLSALSFGNLYLYGGFFETIAAQVARNLPFDTYHERHILTALMGLLGIMYAMRLTSLLGFSQRARFFTLLALALNPVVYGHMFINSKDIPFATAMTMSLYYLVRWYKLGHFFSPALALKAGLCIGMALGIRIGGLMLYGYLGLVWAAIMILGHKNFKIGRAWSGPLGMALLMLLVSYGFMLVFWPWAQFAPLTRPLESLQTMAQFPWCGNIRFAGDLYDTCSEQWPIAHFLPQLFALQLPEWFLLGFALFVGTTVSHSRKQLHESVPLLIVILACFFPLAYVIMSKSMVYDNFRHLLFIVFPTAVLSAAGLDWLFGKLKTKPFANVSCSIVFIALVVFTLVQMVRLHPYQYTYYNAIAGGPSRAWERYEADYWGIAASEALARLEAHLQTTALRRAAPKSYLVFAKPLTIGVHHYCQNSKLLKLTSKESDADYVLNMVRGDLSSSSKKVLLEVTRFGHPLTQVIAKKSAVPTRVQY